MASPRSAGRPASKQRRGPRGRAGARAPRWIVLVDRLRAYVEAGDAPPVRPWIAAVLDARSHRVLGHGVDVDTGEATRVALAQARTLGAPELIYAMTTDAGAALARLAGVPVEPMTREHGRALDAFEELQDSLAGEAPVDPLGRDVASASEVGALLAAAADLLPALAGPDLVVLASFDGEEVGAMVAGGASPVIAEIPALAELLDGGDPADASGAARGLAFVPASEVERDLVVWLRGAGWRARLIPVVRRTDDDGVPAPFTAADVRAVTALARLLVAADVAGALEGDVGQRRVQDSAGHEVVVRWTVHELAAEDDDLFAGDD